LKSEKEVNGISREVVWIEGNGVSRAVVWFGV
jgi:hypothetical protein